MMVLGIALISLSLLFGSDAALRVMVFRVWVGGIAGLDSDRALALLLAAAEGSASAPYEYEQIESKAKLSGEIFQKT